MKRTLLLSLIALLSLPTIGWAEYELLYTCKGYDSLRGHSRFTLSMVRKQENQKDVRAVLSPSLSLQNASQVFQYLVWDFDFDNSKSVFRSIDELSSVPYRHFYLNMNHRDLGAYEGVQTVIGKVDLRFTTRSLGTVNLKELVYCVPGPWPTP